MGTWLRAGFAFLIIAVDAADYVVWRKALGQTVTPFSSADGSGNGIVEQEDWGVWRTHFGTVLPAVSAGSGAAAATSSAPVIQIDEPFAAFITERDAATAEANANVRAASLAALETLALSEEFGTRSHGRIRRFRAADSGGDELLLLAIDRIGRSPRHEISAIEYRGDDDDRTDDANRRTFVDESLAVELSNATTIIDVEEQDLFYIVMWHITSCAREPPPSAL